MTDVRLESIAKMSPSTAASLKAEIRAVHGEYVTPKDARTILKNRARATATDMDYAAMIDAHLRALMPT